MVAFLLNIICGHYGTNLQSFSNRPQYSDLIMFCKRLSTIAPKYVLHNWSKGYDDWCGSFVHHSFRRLWWWATRWSTTPPSTWASSASASRRRVRTRRRWHPSSKTARDVSAASKESRRGNIWTTSGPSTAESIRLVLLSVTREKSPNVQKGCQKWFH